MSDRNKAAFDVLDRMLQLVESVPDIAREAAPDIAYEVESVIRRQILRGEDPDGDAWEPRKADGEKPLQDAAKALKVVAIGDSIFARLDGHIARHHRGIAKGGVKRQILPDEITPPIADAITEVLTDHFRSKLGGK